MELEERIEQRRATQELRRPPARSTRINVPAEGDGSIDLAPMSGPIELVLETTNGEGEIALWLNDDWWTALLKRWGDDPVTVHVPSSPGALLHPVVLHQVEMLRRVVPRWRVVGDAYADDIATDEDIRQVARSFYAEVRLIDGSRAAKPASDRNLGRPTLAELFNQVRQEQARAGVTRPILVRLPAPTTSESSDRENMPNAIPDRQTASNP